MAVLLQEDGRAAAARAHLERALEIFRALGAPHGEAQALSSLGELLGAQGRGDEARAHLEAALAI